jgi:VWFA-related protein
VSDQGDHALPCGILLARNKVVGRGFCRYEGVGLQRIVTSFIGAVVALSCQSVLADDRPSLEPEQETGFVDEVDVTVVNVEVYVRDRQGRPVTGLTAEDFRISQDGIPMPLSNFAVLTPDLFQGRPVSPGEDDPLSEPHELPPLESRPSYVILYIDNENILPRHRNRVMRSVRAFVDQTLIPPVRMMVVSSERSIKVLQPFCDDPVMVNQALDRLSKYAGTRVERDRERRMIIERIEELNTNPDINVPEFYQEPEIAVAQLQIEAQIMAYAERESDSLVDALGALRQVFAMVSGMEGRTAIVHVSSGLPLSPGIGLMYEYAAVFRDNSILVRQQHVNQLPNFHSLAAAANRHGVSLYTIDASGLNPLEGFGADDYRPPAAYASAADLKSYQDSLRYMADATGGLAVFNTNDVSAGLQLIRDDLFSYYSLGYTISASGQDRLHRIRVALPNHPDHDLRYREWYVEKSLATQVQERVFSSLMLDFDDNPMNLRLAVGDPTPAARSRWQVPFEVSFPLRNLTLLPEAGHYVGHLELFLGARDSEGLESLPQRMEYEVRIPAEEYQAARDQRYRIDIQLLVKERQHRVGVALMDRVTHQTSYARVDVAVP